MAVVAPAYKCLKSDLWKPANSAESTRFLNHCFVVWSLDYFLPFFRPPFIWRSTWSFESLFHHPLFGGVLGLSCERDLIFWSTSPSLARPETSLGTLQQQLPKCWKLSGGHSNNNYPKNLTILHWSLNCWHLIFLSWEGIFMVKSVSTTTLPLQYITV